MYSMSVESEVNFGCQFLGTSHLLFERDSVIGLELYQVEETRQHSSCLGPLSLSSVLPFLGLQVHAYVSRFLGGLWGELKFMFSCL